MSLKDDLKTAFIAAEFKGEQYSVEYDNDTGPDDGGFWEFWKVAGGQFNDEDQANFIGMLLNAYRDGKLTIKG